MEYKFSLLKRIIFGVFGLAIGFGFIRGGLLLISAQNLFGIAAGISVLVGGAVITYLFLYTAWRGYEPLLVDEGEDNNEQQV